ncbi:MAG TPA: molybdenum cofactor guanylyltransferase [Bacteroidales bacterium]|jgi:molybdopterin-guanine dinucleotide biosynthesis protein A|nr:molybdenum cofactor guanylyltransferase [Bacteroidales bacterium]
MNISAAILAGGESSRLNYINKESISIIDKTILERQLNVISTFFDDYFSVSKKSLMSDLPFVSDAYVQIGPLAGIHAALKYAKNDYVFVFSCDMPFLNRKIISRMMDEINFYPADIIIPRHKNGIEPLHAIYNKSIIHIIENQINEKKYKIRLLFDKLTVTYIDLDKSDEPEWSFFNVNYPEDVIKAEKYAKQLES